MVRLKQFQDVLAALLMARQLRRHDRWTRDQLRQHQQLMLGRIVRHAASQSRFYRELYGRQPPIDPVQLQELPITNKRMVMDRFDDVVTDRRLSLSALQQHLNSLQEDECYLGEYRVLATTGTSGLRGLFVYDRVAWRIVLANTIRWNEFADIRPRWPKRVRVCTIGADNPMHVTRRIPESGNVGVFKLRHLTATQPLADLVGTLNAFAPEVLHTYPSIAALLAEEQLAGRLEIHPRVITTHSETLTEEMIKRIETVWGTAPFNHYGLTEEPHVGCDCAAHEGLHIFEDLCLVEVLDSHDRPVEPGGLGAKYLLTNLYNRVQPLIRYEVTDLISTTDSPCSCGRPFARITRIAGRSEQALILSTSCGGEVVIPPLALPMRLEALPDIVELELRHAPGAVALLIVPRAGADREVLRAKVQAEIASLAQSFGAEAPCVSVEYCDQIERHDAHMGKLQLVRRLEER